MYCSRNCFGKSRRKNIAKDIRVKNKAEYDREYRKKNKKLLKKKKRAYFERTYDPVKAAKERKKTMAQHVEYCRQPEYKKKKRKYDKKRRAEKFGEFADAYELLQKLEKTINRIMPDRWQRYAQAQRFQWDPETQRRRRRTNAQLESGIDRL